jgi:hypothetical protein
MLIREIIMDKIPEPIFFLAVRFVACMAIFEKYIRSKKRIPAFRIEKYSFATILTGNISKPLFHS